MKEKGTFTTSEGTGGYNNKPLNQFKITMKTAVDQLIEKMSLEDVCKYSNELAEAKEMENEQRQKKENQFVLNMPFDIQPLSNEVEMSSPSHKQELVIGYVIKDAKGVEYYFYEEDGVLKYDGWSADLPTTKTEE
jgi:hypothetical protein